MESCSSTDVAFSAGRGRVKSELGARSGVSSVDGVLRGASVGWPFRCVGANSGVYSGVWYCVLG